MKAKELLADACMNVQDFRSNSTTVNATFPVEDGYNNTEIKVPGVIWDTVKDNVKLKRVPHQVALSAEDHRFSVSPSSSTRWDITKLFSLQDITEEGSA
uniref:Uncharacterized protein n=1 Tax=Parascaris equorum TaxID=6256 RepID=A0A914S520_PAREQ